MEAPDVWSTEKRVEDVFLDDDSTERRLDPLPHGHDELGRCSMAAAVCDALDLRVRGSEFLDEASHPCVVLNRPTVIKRHWAKEGDNIFAGGF